MLTTVDPTRSLGDLVAERPQRAAVLERLALDYCCGGSQTLAQACGSRGLDLQLVRAELARVENEHPAGPDVELRDWRAASLGELCEHIVSVHHDGLRESLPRIEELFARVVRAHGAADPRLATAQAGFRELRAELEPHMAQEESRLFPACLAAEAGSAPVDEALLREHEHEHEMVGDGLAALRALCGGYARVTGRCNTHRVLLGALEGFEHDLHRHVHEENNILMPRARALR